MIADYPIFRFFVNVSGICRACLSIKISGSLRNMVRYNPTWLGEDKQKKRVRGFVSFEMCGCGATNKSCTSKAVQNHPDRFLAK